MHACMDDMQSLHGNRKHIWDLPLRLTEYPENLELATFFMASKWRTLPVYGQNIQSLLLAVLSLLFAIFVL